jgi:hypothetical protein
MRLEPSVSSVKLYLANMAERIDEPRKSLQFICGYEAGFVGESLYHEMSAAGLTCVILASLHMICIDKHGTHVHHFQNVVDGLPV